MDLRTAILTACAVLAIAPLARILFLFGFREPRLARVVGSDYGEGERLADRDFHLVALVDGKFTGDDFHYRDRTVRACYEVRGREILGDVTVSVHKGDRIDTSLIVWIDPADPHRPTARGPGYWAMWLLLDGFVALPAWLLLP